MEKIKKNRQFLSNIYHQGEFQGHAFICKSEQIPVYEIGDYTLSTDSISKWVPWVVENYQRDLQLLEKTGNDSVPVAKLATGTHIFAQAFGCNVHEFEDNNPCALPMLNCPDSARALKVPNLYETPLARVFELGDAVRKELGKDVPLGPCDMQSGFDTACLIYEKTEFMCAMLLEPEPVKELINKCAELFKTFLIEFRKEFPSLSPCHCPGTWTPPEMAPWLSNDECGTMSTEMFEEFCLPELLELAEHFGGLGMHCCANAEHQFDSFKKIPGFYGFNRVAAQQGYQPLLEHFNGSGNPVHVLAWLSDEDTEMLIKNSTEGTRFIFNLMGATAETAKPWLEKMRQLSPRTD